jgi:hypothetical protein
VSVSESESDDEEDHADSSEEGDDVYPPDESPDCTYSNISERDTPKPERKFRFKGPPERLAAAAAQPHVEGHHIQHAIVMRQHPDPAAPGDVHVGLGREVVPPDAHIAHVVCPDGPSHTAYLADEMMDDVRNPPPTLDVGLDTRLRHDPTPPRPRHAPQQYDET